MKHKKYTNYSTEEFIMDEYFMEWVLHPNQKNDHFWKDFLKNYPTKKQQIKDAILLIKSMQVVDPAVSKQRLDLLYKDVQSNLYQSKKTGLRIAKIAAMFLLLFSIGGGLFYLQTDSQSFPLESAIGDQLENGRVILPDGTISEFETEQTQIRQMGSGELTINNDTLSVGDVKGKSEKQTFAQVVIPFGKRSEITLSDGTKIWLNAGSQLFYPVNFTRNSREVFLSGEAFFDVKSDPEKPFHVITRDMKIRVIGTRFNVTSYTTDQITQAVLLSGKINAAKNKRFSHSMELEPGERIVYNKKEGNLKKDKVKTELYVSWVNGYLVFEKEPVENIFKKLERYYDKNILTENFTSHSKFTGKLDLSEDLEKVLKNIGFSASFSVDCENDVYLIEKK